MRPVAFAMFILALATQPVLAQSGPSTRPPTRPAGPAPASPGESILSEDVPGGPPNPDPPPYTLLRFNESYSYLSDARNRTDSFDALKYIPLDRSNPESHLSFGGEIRERYEHFDNPGFGTGPVGSNDYLLQRIDLHADVHVNERLRFFVQGISGLQWGQEGESPPVNQNPLELQQAFADVVLGDPTAEDPRLTIRTGRFEMSFGAGRLLATRAAPNIPFKFDGIELIGALGKSRVYAFAVRPSEEEKYRFDGQNDNQTFWGTYLTTPLGGPPNTSVDLYYLGFRDEDAHFVSGGGTEERHAFGTRLFGATGGWDYDVEPVLQTGDLGGRDILAWTFASDNGYTFEGLPGMPRLGCKLDLASGDTGGGDGNLGTFNPLFFKSGYFNDASVLRPSNLIDVHPSLQFRPAKGLVVTLASDVIWRYSTHDGVYGPGGNTELPRDGGSRYAGTTAEAAVVYQFNRHLSWTGSYVHLFSSEYVSKAGGGDVDYFGTWITFVF